MRIYRDDLTPEEYARACREQLDSVRDVGSSKPEWALSASDWRMVASLWLLIQRGVLILQLERKQLDRLRSQDVRIQADRYIRNHGLTIELAARAAGCEDDLDVHFRIEAERPVLHG
jgi:hypothetical protein